MESVDHAGAELELATVELLALAKALGMTSTRCDWFSERHDPMWNADRIIQQLPRLNGRIKAFAAALKTYKAELDQKCSRPSSTSN